MKVKANNTRRIFVGGPIKHAISQDEYDQELRMLITLVLSNLENEGYEVFSAHLAEGFGLVDTQPSSSDVILRDFGWMKKCDTFVAVLPAGSEGVFRTDGTHVELGWASALNKPIVALVPLPLPKNYGHFLRGLDSIAKVSFVNIAEVQINPSVLIKAVNEQYQ